MSKSSNSPSQAYMFMNLVTIALLLLAMVFVLQAQLAMADKDEYYSSAITPREKAMWAAKLASLRLERDAGYDLVTQ